MVYAQVSKTCDLTVMWVRLPPPVLIYTKDLFVEAFCIDKCRILALVRTAFAACGGE